MPSNSNRANSDPALTPFLLFRLWGPMAAWGDIAVGERRGTWNRPSRSAVLGLVAAALGHPRQDRAAHDRLERGLGFAVRVDDAGRPMRDYHTAQSPGEQRGKRWATRRDELADPRNLNTILSERTYQLEMNAVIVLWCRPGTEGPTLDEIAARLTEPVFAPYLGRKSCPLGLPLMPRPIEAVSPAAALKSYDSQPFCEHKYPPARDRWREKPRSELWLDADDAHTFGLTTDIRTVRRDRVRDRPRWLFSDRAEVRIAPEPTP
jgi:CRISPR system Cascade subunit CasD